MIFFLGICRFHEFRFHESIKRIQTTFFQSIMDKRRRKQLAAVLVVDAALDHYIKHNIKIPQHTSILTGNAYTLELLETENMNRFKRAGRMDKDVFLLLVDEMRIILSDTRKGVSVERYTLNVKLMCI